MKKIRRIYEQWLQLNRLQCHKTCNSLSFYCECLRVTAYRYHQTSNSAFHNWYHHVLRLQTAQAKPLFPNHVYLVFLEMRLLYGSFEIDMVKYVDKYSYSIAVYNSFRYVLSLFVCYVILKDLYHSIKNGL